MGLLRRKSQTVKSFVKSLHACIKESALSINEYSVVHQRVGECQYPFSLRVPLSIFRKCRYFFFFPCQRCHSVIGIWHLTAAPPASQPHALRSLPLVYNAVLVPHDPKLAGGGRPSPPATRRRGRPDMALAASFRMGALSFASPARSSAPSGDCN